MTIVHGESDDIVVIDGGTYAESEIDCAEKDVRIFFTDGTIIRVGYPKKNKAIWQIDVEKRGNAAQLHTACEIEDDRNYSDVFEIAAEVRSHELVQKKIPEPENEPKAEMDKSHQKFSGINCLDCHYRHENGNCTAVGGFCTSVPAAYCKLIPELKETLAKAMHWVMRLNDLEWCEMTPEEREDVANFVKKYNLSKKQQL